MSVCVCVCVCVCEGVGLKEEGPGMIMYMYVCVKTEGYHNYDVTQTTIPDSQYTAYIAIGVIGKFPIIPAQVSYICHMTGTDLVQLVWVESGSDWEQDR